MDRKLKQNHQCIRVSYYPLICSHVYYYVHFYKTMFIKFFDTYYNQTTLVQNEAQVFFVSIEHNSLNKRALQICDLLLKIILWHLISSL